MFESRTKTVGKGSSVFGADLDDDNFGLDFIDLGSGDGDTASAPTLAPIPAAAPAASARVIAFPDPPAPPVQAGAAPKAPARTVESQQERDLAEILAAVSAVPEDRQYRLRLLEDRIRRQWALLQDLVKEHTALAREAAPPAPPPRVEPTVTIHRPRSLVPPRRAGAPA